MKDDLVRRIDIARALNNIYCEMGLVGMDVVKKKIGDIPSAGNPYSDDWYIGYDAGWNAGYDAGYLAADSYIQNESESAN